ncbi:MAG: hypoxanthine phosphoribosyltransferase [Phycisphaerae bacterium]|nr:hypoxanthine phosphoribosyltransferase [Phycisphaerae bacterium]
MDDDIERILIPRERIARRVAELADEIGRTYSDSAAALTVVAILSGSVIFLADLMRQLPIRMKIGLITVSSYAGATTTSRGASILGELRVDVRGRHVLVVDDILDTGRTLRLVTAELRQREPVSVRTCVLLRKPAKVPPDVKADFVGFDVEDAFVVGYGLDYDDHYRNYPDIGILRPELYASA